MAEIELDNVTKRYADGFEAVKHIEPRRSPTASS